MATKKKSSSTSSLVITCIAVILAIAAVIFVIITFNGSNNENPAATGAPNNAPSVNVSDDVINEMSQGAFDLLQKNYKIYQYFTYGMTVNPEPYGNKPEDGFYTCSNSDFENFDKFSDYVKSVYTDEVAQKLLTDPFGNGPVYGNDNGELGLSADFTASTEEGNSWADVQYVCTALSETECSIAVTLKDSAGADVEKTVKMLKTADGWRLEEMIG
ncbi:MAG: hypothetical protein NC203_09870 [Firmicutes bacterium]|nr:hypothetical protein [[Eubacterium] siraeum]MCM1488658.1 hypothetical protein [Bacillota bacterium]